MSIEERVIRIIQDLCDEKVSHNENTRISDLYLDSLKMVLLLVNIEEEFGIVLDEADMNPYDLILIRDIVDLVEKYGGK